MNKIFYILQNAELKLVTEAELNAVCNIETLTDYVTFDIDVMGMDVSGIVRVMPYSIDFSEIDDVDDLIYYLTRDIEKTFNFHKLEITYFSAYELAKMLGTHVYEGASVKVLIP